MTDSPVIRLGQMELRFVATPEQTRGALSMFELRIPPGSRVPAIHSHAAVDEVFYVLEGTLTFTVAGAKRELRAGESVVVPGGTEHNFENLHDVTVRGLSVQAPGAIGPEYYGEIAAIISAGGPPDVGRLHGVMGRYGVVPG